MEHEPVDWEAQGCIVIGANREPTARILNRTPHILPARRRIGHTVSTRCGCNPDAVNDGERWWWLHHAFPDELA